MGQVKYKGKKGGQQTSFGKKVLMGICRMFRRKVKPEKEKSDGERREAPQLRGMFRRKVKPDKEKEKSDGERREAPQLREIRRFASKRESGLDGFDWRATQRFDDDDDDEAEEKMRIGRKSELVVMPVGGGIDVEPKEEVNLWKRRTMAPPIPLVLSS